MSSSVAAGLLGHDYQGRIFLAYAAQLRIPSRNIAQVGYEHDLVRAFDDVVLYYRRPVIDESYGEVHVDFFQIKYQVRQGEMVTWAGLMDPDFINASKVSLLQRVRDGVREMADDGRGARFTLLSPRPIGEDVRQMMSNASDTIDPSVLFDGTTRTDRAKLRKQLKDHLGLDSDEELRRILAAFRIRTTRSLQELQHEADVALREAGMRPWTSTERAARYDDLPKKLVQSDIKLFTPERWEELVRREDLVVGPPLPHGAPAKRIGIRSFRRGAERLHEELDATCCLLEHFDERFIRDPQLWHGTVLPKVEAFLTNEIADAVRVDLHLPTHTSIAFAAGWHCDLKAQVDIAPVQTGAVWRPDPGAPRRTDLWAECKVERLGDGVDVALCLSPRHNVHMEASDFIRRQLPEVGQLLHLVPAGGEGANSVRDGTHAFQLADAAVAETIAFLPRGAVRPTVHLFMAGPVGLIFMLGRVARRLGRVTLYEHDFQRQRAEAYEPSLTLG